MLSLGGLALVLGLGMASTLSRAIPDYTLIIAQAPHGAAARSAPGGASAYSPLPLEGGRIVALSPRGAVSVLTAGFVSAGDPALSFDAKRMVFAGKRSAAEKWNVWEMNVDGSNKRQLTADFGNCAEPRYVAMSSITPPDFDDKVRWIIFTSDGAGKVDAQGQGLSRAIYARNIDPIKGRGIVTWRTTYNLSSDFSPMVLSDGRVVFASHQPGRSGSLQGSYPLLATNWDGTGVNLFLIAQEKAALMTMACELPDRTVVFVESSGDTRDGAGRLARISLKRPLHSSEVISKGDGTYLNPRALPDGRLLVSYSGKEENRAIYLFDPAKGMPGQKVHQDRKWDNCLAAAVVERPEPQGLLSAVVDSEKTADLHCINVYESDLPGSAGIKVGDVKSVRLVEGVPASGEEGRRTMPPDASASSNVHTRILGEVPVEPDGSFYVRIPGDTPFYVQLLDAAGMSLRTQRGWIWVRSGTSRQCLGCHENKELAPENRVTDALLEIRRHVLTGPASQRRMGADFRHSVMPLLQAKCLHCHQGAKGSAAPELSATATQFSNKAYESLVMPPSGQGADARERYVRPGSARTSPLLKLLAAPAGGAGRHPGVALDSSQLRTLFEWIDLGARWEN